MKVRRSLAAALGTTLVAALLATFPIQPAAALDIPENPTFLDGIPGGAGNHPNLMWLSPGGNTTIDGLRHARWYYWWEDSRYLIETCGNPNLVVKEYRGLIDGTLSLVTTWKGCPKSALNDPETDPDTGDAVKRYLLVGYDTDVPLGEALARIHAFPEPYNDSSADDWSGFYSFNNGSGHRTYRDGWLEGAVSSPPSEDHFWPGGADVVFNWTAPAASAGYVPKTVGFWLTGPTFTWCDRIGTVPDDVEGNGNNYRRALGLEISQASILVWDPVLKKVVENAPTDLSDAYTLRGCNNLDFDTFDPVPGRTYNIYVKKDFPSFPVNGEEFRLHFEIGPAYCGEDDWAVKLTGSARYGGTLTFPKNEYCESSGDAPIKYRYFFYKKIPAGGSKLIQHGTKRALKLPGCGPATTIKAQVRGSNFVGSDGGWVPAKAVSIPAKKCVAPKTPSPSGKASVAKGKTITFTWTKTAGTTYQCRVDTTVKQQKGTAGKPGKKAIPWKACASPYQVKTGALKKGDHTFYLRAKRNGVTDKTPAAKKFKVK